MKIYSINLAVYFIIIFSFFVSISAQTKNKAKIFTEKEIKTDIEKVKCKNSERLDAVKKLFKEKGVTDEELKTEKRKGVENLVITKRGQTKEIIVIGAHYDELGGGCGAIDNWSGIVIVANLYGTIKNLDTKKTYKFVAFDKEEQGLLGSKYMANNIPKEERIDYCSMVNFDSFGLSYPQAMRNISNKKLVSMAKKVATNMKLPFAKASISNASSDSASFNKVKIPAITFHGLNNKWKKFLHSYNDQLKNINIKSVFYGYRFGLSFISQLEAEKCNAYKK